MSELSALLSHQNPCESQEGRPARDGRGQGVNCAEETNGSGRRTGADLCTDIDRRPKRPRHDFVSSRALFLFAVGALPATSSALAQTVGQETPLPRFTLEWEAGAVWASRNDVQIPNETGTRFSLTELAGSGPEFANRVTLAWNITRRHRLRLLAAPLTITGTGEFEAPVSFAGRSFTPGVRTSAEYRFNSYRLTYSYRFHDGPTWSWAGGFTAKVRDAKVELRQPGQAARDVNVGFVPLLHLSASARIAPRWLLR